VRQRTWKRFVGELKYFRGKCGHTTVPAEYGENPWLAQKTQRIRSNLALLSIAQLRRLNAMHFYFGRWQNLWVSCFLKAVDWKNRHGHFYVHSRRHSLRYWIIHQRARRESAGADRIQLLNRIGFSWQGREDWRDCRDLNWFQTYRQLRAFKKRFGHANVPDSWNENAYLGKWLGKQRRLRRQEKLDTKKQSLLDRTAICWEPMEKRWERRFQSLRAFHKRFGHCRISRQDDSSFFAWVIHQRRRLERGRLSKEKVLRLKQLGAI
jgi:hypothetical protein